MGQKVNPVGMRIGINKNWNSRWYASEKDYSKYLMQDIALRKTIEKNLPKDAYLSHVEIERKRGDKGTYVKVMIFVGRPGLVIGQEGAAINALKAKLAVLIDKDDTLSVDVVEVKQPSLDAKIMSEKICQQLEARASFRIVQKKAISEVRKAGAKGVKTEVSGRLAGAEIARSEGYKEGTMAINTLRSDIDYACSEAHTTYGKLGVKVWICRGDVTNGEKPVQDRPAAPRRFDRKGE
jgi:small subunit ribosomal protein S3